MSDLAARFIYSPLLSTALKVVCLFCVLGLALSIAIVPDDRAGVSGLGVVPHRMTSSIFVASFAAPTA
jgi:hypothetical protein